MSTYRHFNLLEFVDEYGMDFVLSMIEGYTCPMNPDIEQFLRQRAVGFAQQGIAQTHLVFCAGPSEPLLVGFFALTNKVLVVQRDEVSKNAVQAATQARII